MTTLIAENNDRFSTHIYANTRTVAVNIHARAYMHAYVRGDQDICATVTNQPSAQTVKGGCMASFSDIGFSIDALLSLI